MAKKIKIDTKKEGSERSEVQVVTEGTELYITGVPETDLLAYIVKSPKSDFYVVHRPKESWDNESCRLHIGKEDQLKEAAVKKFTRFIGGETYIHYVLDGKKGELHFPASLDKKQKPSDNYNKKKIPLEKLV